MAYATAKSLTDGSIPVIDITALRDGSSSQSVAEELHAASQGLGFIYIRGHGIPENLLENARLSAFDFFRSDAEEKKAVQISGSHRGWLAIGGAKMQDDANSDLKESFVWGYVDGAGNTLSDHPLRGANRWPAKQPELSQHCMAWFDAANEVARHLLRGFALGLQLDEGFFLRQSEQPLSRASCVYYPAQAESLGVERFGVGPHTDFGVLTVLCQDNTGGLQVQDVNGEWLEASPIDGTLIVNVADLLSRWTDGAYKSTPHRVVNSSGRERLSLVLAYDPNPDTLIDAREVFGHDYQSSEPPITCGDYLLWRFGKAFTYRRENG